MADDIRAHANFIPHSPQKVRLVIDLVRGREITDALDMLKFVQNAAALPVAKVLASAMANAEENFGVSRDDLYVYKIYAESFQSESHLKKIQEEAQALITTVLSSAS